MSSIILSGYVAAAYDGEMLPGAHVYTHRPGGLWGITADANGYWMQSFNPGETVTISYIGYQSATFTVPDAAPGNPSTIRLEAGITFDPVEVFPELPDAVDPVEPDPVAPGRGGAVAGIVAAAVAFFAWFIPSDDGRGL